MARPTKITGMDVTPFSGVKIQKVGAIYTRTLEEGGAIYLEKGVSESNQQRYSSNWYQGPSAFTEPPALKSSTCESSPAMGSTTKKLWRPWPAEDLAFATISQSTSLYLKKKKHKFSNHLGHVYCCRTISCPELAVTCCSTAQAVLQHSSEAFAKKFAKRDMRTILKSYAK